MDLNEKEDEKIVTFSESKPLVDTEVTPKELDKTVEKANNDRKLAIKYGLINDASTKDDSWLFTENSYVELTFNSKDEDGNKVTRQILYKITRQGDRIFAYPINKLDENETSDVSLTKENNKYKPEAFYLEYINLLYKNKYFKKLEKLNSSNFYIIFIKFCLPV